jgi:hypothetical protein
LLRGEYLSAEAFVRYAGAFGGECLGWGVSEIAKGLEADGWVRGQEPVEGVLRVHRYMLAKISNPPRFAWHLSFIAAILVVRAMFVQRGGFVFLIFLLWNSWALRIQVGP